MGKDGFGGIMKKAREMQENMRRVQQELGDKTVTGQAGAGVVKVLMNGQFGCEGVTLGDEVMQEDKEMLEALIAAAVSDATKKVQQLTEREMGSLTAGVTLPPGIKLPF